MRLDGVELPCNKAIKLQEVDLTLDLLTATAYKPHDGIARNISLSRVFQKKLILHEEVPCYTACPTDN